MRNIPLCIFDNPLHYTNMFSSQQTSTHTFFFLQGSRLPCRNSVRLVGDGSTTLVFLHTELSVSGTNPGFGISDTAGRFQDQILLVGSRIRYYWQVLGSDTTGRFQDQILLVGSRIRYCWQVLGYYWQVLGSDTTGRFQDTTGRFQDTTGRFQDTTGRFQDQILLVGSRIRYCWQVLGSDATGRFQDTAGRFQDQILLVGSRI